ncbi:MULTISPECIES: NADP-dependent oxidoreductase [Psychrobacter]|uniref:Oxidoreductase YncB n=1 Tax=Psychrobacter alimentarius TaxID=261164 RepID=A0ABN4N351_9GAMM|nr:MULTISPECIES: NADP-dependent oxidoreductase [Psychrobacter]AMT97142.1 Putative oxidoreductase YncB [Psychrobacter alimentarius]QCB30527.1 NADP-dependent oxidoreductase [Psychrobacter sp. PAMC27889]
MSFDKQQNQNTNRQIKLASRPQGEPKAENFDLVTSDIPSPNDNEMLLRTVYLSLDPYMRGRMSDAKSYADPLAVGDVIMGGTVAQVVESNIDKFAVGDLVVSNSGWQDYSVSNGEGVLKLDKDMKNPSYGLGVLGMPGFTGYMGLTDIGKPQKGETLVVAAATGPVGATVGQVGKQYGTRTVGVAGGKEKCDFAVNELGFDICIDHKADDFAEQLKAACPDGIDIYYENVGGHVFDAVMPLLNAHARIPVCGLVAQYNATDLPEGKDRLSMLTGLILSRRLTIKGFIIFEEYGDHYPEFLETMSKWVESGDVKTKEYIAEGLDHAPDAFVRMLNGDNFGKTVVKVAEVN